MALVSSANGGSKGGIDQVLVVASPSTSIPCQNGVKISTTSQQAPVNDMNPGQSYSPPSLQQPDNNEHRIENSRLLSASTVSSTSKRFRKRLNGIMSKKLDWESIKTSSKKKMSDPYNIALFVWGTCFVTAVTVLCLVLTGALDGTIKTKEQRDTWLEVINQILNAQFTLFILYLHPKRLYHLVLLCRWKPEDAPVLRQVYCKNGARKPKERTHMIVVVVLLNVNCIAQYAICGILLGYKKSDRPMWAIGLGALAAFLSAIVARVYSSVSPLGKDYVSENNEHDEESQSSNPSEKLLYAFTVTSVSNDNNDDRDQIIVVEQPEWQGGLFDVWDDLAVAYRSLFCSCCVFGWNMERLGFGNMYVHIGRFLLFCFGPFFIFNLAAVNIDNEYVKEAFAATGVILLVFGLLYGGFWRIRMRNRFNLPPNDACCGKPGVTDCAQWLFCCWCSLAQEVRTANFYGVVVVEDEFRGITSGGNAELMVSSMVPPTISSIHREQI